MVAMPRLLRQSLLTKLARRPVKRVITDRELNNRLAARLECRMGGRIRELQLTTLSDGLLLQGRVTTYYAKLLVCEVAVDLSGSRISIDEIVII